MQNENGSETVANSRRQFLKKAGKLAVYTPPAMVTLMAPSADALATSGGFRASSESKDCPPGLLQFGCNPPGLDK